MAKSKHDISDLSLNQLLALQEKIEARIQEVAAAELSALEDKVKALKPLTTKKRKSSGTRGKKAPVKFKDPATGKTWSGRGVTPVWLREYEEQGKKREKYAV